MRHIGIFGGTFDPIHEGHVLFGQVAAEQFGVDSVVFMPEPEPRRKPDVTPLEHRIAMIKTLTDHDDLFDIFVPQDKGAHTPADSMPAIREMYGTDSDFSLLLGGDVFEFLPQWDDYEQLIQEVSFIVALRSEDDGEIVIPLASELGADADFIPSPLSSVSSSKVRQAVRDHTQPKGVSQPVLDYIEQHGLYRE